MAGSHGVDSHVWEADFQNLCKFTTARVERVPDPVLTALAHFVGGGDSSWSWEAGIRKKGQVSSELGSTGDK